MAASVEWAPDRFSARAALAWQILFGIALLAVWEVCGREFGSTWTSLPSLILVRLGRWAATDLAVHVYTTLLEVVTGMIVGVPLGVVAGLWLGRSPTLAIVLRPVIVALYSIPFVTMAPLLILWFGLFLKPKIVLVGIVSFFLVFFSTFSGAREIDQDLVTGFRLMGSSRREELWKVVAPASAAWIMSGIRTAMPYALAAATTGELLAASRGMGFLLSHAAAQFDMTGLYAALLVLLVLGALTNELVVLVERRLLRWRHDG